MRYWTKDDHGRWTSSAQPATPREVREAQAQRLEFFAEAMMKVARLWLRLACRTYGRRPRLRAFALREATAYEESALKLRAEARERRGQ